LKVTDLATLAGELAGPRAGGKTVVLTNGAFDLLHVGHVRYLRAAAKLGDILVVAVNDDDSVRRLKGTDRPVFPLEERMELVASLEGVGYVVSFGEDDVREVIRSLKPDVHAKGTDYTPETVPERDEVLKYGGKVEICGDPKDHSTSTVLARLRGS
jgi:rfaE bifunctional protein nucleotidyltransferase chain/domain